MNFLLILSVCCRLLLLIISSHSEWKYNGSCRPGTLIAVKVMKLLGLIIFEN